MKDPTVNIDLKVTITVELTESEARALDGIFGYNADVFLKAFYEKMGRNYVQPYQEGVRSLHKRMRALVAGPLKAVDEARTRLPKRP